MYLFNSRVRYSEMNHQKNTMDPSSIINYFQDCSTFQSEDLNLGLSYLQKKNRIWLLTGWQLQIKSPIHLGDQITIGTWPYDFKGFYGYRNFIMKNDREEVLAVANSIWVYIDTTTNRPTKVPDDHAGYTLEPPYPMEYADRKINLPDNLVSQPKFKVIKSNIDSYNHVNNGQYIKMAEEYLPDTFITREMRVEYRKQAVLDDTIVPMICCQKNNCVVVLSDQENKPYAIIEFIQ
ncbi:acyl-[acyl-carrier-protein] thioesterase [Mobilitalea sibirica]|uniref:Acyl-[acyl-carrier-protein] thioesterase n=1 Tax=Mobilitalea sibirica TaxID=1462919 RepID=A0A8J7KXD9_9FIRM|nr:acyl-ACP thioesterase domain-containing protein [Mobilitalea sibirica]MBH1942445.1 acyl-[acyl-carrier-protein] thioesterase [Mobilitalea sibirica]